MAAGWTEPQVDRHPDHGPGSGAPTTDDVNGIIVPGAFRRTLRERDPRMVLGPDWTRVVGRTISAIELLPGDPRL